MAEDEETVLKDCDCDAETSAAARFDPELRLDIQKGIELAGSRAEYLEVLRRGDTRILTRIDGIQSGFTTRNLLVIKMHVERLKAEVRALQCPKLQQELGVFLNHLLQEEITSPIELVKLFRPVGKSLIELRGAIMSQLTNSEEERRAAASHIKLVLDKLAQDAQVYERWGFHFNQGTSQNSADSTRLSDSSANQDESITWHLESWKTQIVGVLVAAVAGWMWWRFEYQQGHPP